eukprot:3827095-Prymnesium_polylepis.1
MACWLAGLLACWLAGLLACLLVYDLPLRRQVVPRRDGPPPWPHARSAHRGLAPCGSVPCGRAAVWPCGRVAVWPCAVWPCGSVPCGRAAVRRC